MIPKFCLRDVSQEQHFHVLGVGKTSQKLNSFLTVLSSIFPHCFFIKVADISSICYSYKVDQIYHRIVERKSTPSQIHSFHDVCNLSTFL